MKQALLLAALVVACGQVAPTVRPDLPWSGRIAESFLLRQTDEAHRAGLKWTYEEGLMLHALVELGRETGDPKYLAFVRKIMDSYVDTAGNIRSYALTDYNLDNIAPGRALLAVYTATHEEKYRRAAELLLRQLQDQPRTAEGGYWHKKIYPYQMWLDGLYMAEPFRAECAKMFDTPADFNDIADQFIWMAAHARDSVTGLMYHGWDERKEQRWADRRTGCSPSFWARSMGWYAMGLVDVLSDLPADHPKRAALTAILRDLAGAVEQYQDSASGLWYQVIDQGTRPGNYLETSASCMFAYAFARAARLGFLPGRFVPAARAAFDGILRRQVTTRDDGSVDLAGICRSAGLGGSPYRDGSFDYYIREPQVTNDLKGVGAFLLAAIELEQVDHTVNH